MSVNQTIKTALSTLNIPVVAGRYTGSDEKYITFNVADDRGGNYRDDEPGCNVVKMQIHLFVPLDFNYIQLKKQIRSALFNAGFSYAVVSEQTEDDCEHIIFECEIITESEVE